MQLERGDNQLYQASEGGKSMSEKFGGRSRSPLAHLLGGDDETWAGCRVTGDLRCPTLRSCGILGFHIDPAVIMLGKDAPWEVLTQKIHLLRTLKQSARLNTIKHNLSIKVSLLYKPSGRSKVQLSFKSNIEYFLKSG